MSWRAPRGRTASRGRRRSARFALHAITKDGRPAVGAVISLVATQYFGTADADGVRRDQESPAGSLRGEGRSIRASRCWASACRRRLKFRAARDTTTLATAHRADDRGVDRRALRREPPVDRRGLGLHHRPCGQARRAAGGRREGQLCRAVRQSVSGSGTSAASRPAPTECSRSAMRSRPEPRSRIASCEAARRARRSGASSRRIFWFFAYRCGRSLRPDP